MTLSSMSVPNHNCTHATLIRHEKEAIWLISQLFLSSDPDKTQVMCLIQSVIKTCKTCLMKSMSRAGGFFVFFWCRNGFTYTLIFFSFCACLTEVRNTLKQVKYFSLKSFPAFQPCGPLFTLFPFSNGKNDSEVINSCIR